MNQPEKPNKRVVSTAEYLEQWMKRALISLSGIVILSAAYIGIFCGLFLCLILVIFGLMITLNTSPLGVVGIVIGLGLGYVITRLGVVFSHRGLRMISKAEDMDIGTRSTRVKIGDLPASDSLVRASSEPVQEQESVLLRASIHSQQTPSDQLLRSVEE